MDSSQAYCVIVMFFVGLKVILCKQKAAMSLECVGRFDLGLFISVALFPQCRVCQGAVEERCVLTSCASANLRDQVNPLKCA